MVEAWSKANKTRENWMKPEMLQVVPEEEEPLEEQPPVPPDETPEAPEEANWDQKQENEGQGAQKPQGLPKGQVRKLTDYFNQIGGPVTPKVPRTVQKAAVTPKTPGKKKMIGAGGVSKSRKKGRPKIDEP